MKNITELSEQEILILTDDQLGNMVKLQMAESGIKILSMPVEPTYEPLPPKTEICYSVSGFSYHFQNKEDADTLSEAIVKLAQKCVTYDYKYSQTELKHLKKLPDYSLDGLGTVKQELFYNQQDIESIRETKERNDALKREYDADLAEYNKSKEDSAIIIEEIYNQYYAVQKKYYNMNTMKEKFTQYISLAEGDKTVAMKFLKNAYRIDEETESFVLSEVPTVEVEKPAPVLVKSDEVNIDDLPNF